jgi:hypothetical protein
VPEGSTSATFEIQTVAVASDVLASIVANYGSTNITDDLTIRPPAIQSIELDPTSVLGGNSSTATVTLNGAVVGTDIVVNLSSSNTAIATVPATVNIPVGQSSATFNVTTSPVVNTATASIGASLGVSQASADLTVQAPGPQSVTANPSRFTGGAGTTLTVTLNAPAPTGGLVVNLASNNTALQVPASVNIPAGQTSANAGATSVAVRTTIGVQVTASVGSQSASTTVTILPPLVQTLTLNPPTVTSGATSTGTVTLTANAPVGGLSVGLRSNRTDALVPASVLVPAGTRTANFVVRTLGVRTQTVAEIRAGYAGYWRMANLTILPAKIVSIAFSPNIIMSGFTSTGVVTLDGPAPAGGAVVNLLSGSTKLTVPGTVTVAAGSRTATFTATGQGAVANTRVGVNARYQGLGRSTTVTVVPFLISLRITPDTVRGGINAGGYITISGPAPATGVTVTIQSNSTFATTPTAIAIRPGATTGAFTIRTRRPPTKSVRATITVRAGGKSASQFLTITN